MRNVASFNTLSQLELVFIHLVNIISIATTSNSAYDKESVNCTKTSEVLGVRI